MPTALSLKLERSTLLGIASGNMEKNITPPTVCNLGSPYDFWGKKKLIKTAQLEQIQICSQFKYDVKCYFFKVELNKERIKEIKTTLIAF